MKRIGVLPALFCTLAVAVAGQTGAPPEKPSMPAPDSKPSIPPKLIPRSREERERTYRAEHRILLNVLAVDSLGNPVSGLKPQDFTLLDNERPQKLASFREVRGTEGLAPARIILLLDAVNNSSSSLNYEIKEVSKYFASHRESLSHPTSVAILTRSGIQEVRPSLDAKKLWRDSKILFKGLRPANCDDFNTQVSSPFEIGGRGDQNIGFSAEAINDGNCLSQKFVLSVSALLSFVADQQNVPGRAILIWIGPGWPLLSGPEFLPDTKAMKENLFDHLVALSNALIEAQVTVDAISSPDMFRTAEQQNDRDKPLFEAVPKEQYVSAADLSLRSIAHQSGGRNLQGKDIAGYIAKCVADARVYYAVSFDSVPSAEPDEYHTLQVRIDKPGVKAVTKTAYYGKE